MKPRIVIIFLIFGFQNVIYAYNSISSIPDSIYSSIESLSYEDQIDFLTKQCWDNRSQNPSLAVDLGIHALSLAEKYKKHKNITQLNNYIGSIYLNYMHNIPNSIPYFQKARDLSIGLNDSVQLGFAYNNFGDLYFKNSNIPLAINYNNLAYETFVKLNFKRGIVYSLKNLGEAYTAIKDYNNASVIYFNLLELETELINSIGIANSLIEIGNTHFMQNKYDDALRYLNDALKLSIALDNNELKARSFSGLAYIYNAIGDTDKTFELIEKTRAINISSKDFPKVINHQLGVAILLSHIKKRKEGEEVLNNAIDLANKLGFHSYILKSYYAKAEFYTNLDDIELAKKSYEEYHAVSDSLLADQSLETLLEMNKRVNAQLTIEKISKDLESRRKERVYMFIIIVLFFILALMVYWRFRTISDLNKQLIETNNTKDKLFSIIAHDLKAPFNALLGFSEILVEDIENKNFEHLQKYSNIVHKTSTETYALITNLLNWSISQRGLLKLKLVPLDISALIEEIIVFNTPQAQLKNISFDDSGVKKEMVLADRNSIHTVLNNLVSNAIKFTHKNGNISFSTHINKSSIEIDIVDNGVGITKDALKNLFDIKNSKNTTGTNNEKGTGLGLIICKEFIEKNGGNLSVNSEVNKGSTFKVTLQKS